MSSAQKRLKETLNAYNDYCTNTHSVIKMEIMDAVAEILKDDDSTYKAYGYTPYSNDEINCYYSFWMDDDGYNQNSDSYNRLEKFFYSVGDDLLKSIYGDHKMFEISKHMIAVSDYDHD